MSEVTKDAVFMLSLPDYLLLEITSYLSCNDKYNLSLTCRTMYEIFRDPKNWRYVKLKFCCPEDGKSIAYVKQFKAHFWNVIIEVDTSKICNRENAILVTNLISSSPLKGLTFFTTEDKPLFYGGVDIIKAINNIFSFKKNTDFSQLSNLQYIDFEQFLFHLDDATLHTLHYSHKCLKYLYLGEMSSKITKQEMVCMSKMCTTLKIISVSVNCLSKEILSIFTEAGRTHLKYLSIKCGLNCTASICKEVFDSDIWLHIKNCLPSLTVGIHVNEDCHFDLVKIMLKPEIPYSFIRFETFTPLYEEVDIVGKYYKETLEKLIIHPSKERKELDDSLLVLCNVCERLCSLHVFVLLKPETIEEILKKRPLMSKRETYTLRSYRGFGPWATEEFLTR